MTDDNSGWGDDFDDEGNIIGNVPDDENNSIIKNHPGKLIGIWVLWLLIGISNAQTGLSAGFLLGAAGGSFVLAFIIVYFYVWIRY